MRTMLVVLMLGLAVSRPVRAESVDFERFSDGQRIGEVTVSSNEVTFSVGDSYPGVSGWVTDVGDPVTALKSGDGEGTPTGRAAGSLFLSDERSETGDVEHGRNYFIDFKNPVSSLQLDLFDYRADGMGDVGDTAQLRVYSDAARTEEVGRDTFTVTSGLPDGNVATLIVDSASKPIRAASLITGEDTGTGIDNVVFATISRLPVELNLSPDALNVKSKGKFVTAYIEPPDGYSASQIDISTVVLTPVQGEQVEAEASPAEVRDHDGDGAEELMVKFDRRQVIAALEGLAPPSGESVEMLVQGQLNDGTDFSGRDSILVIDQGGRKRNR